MDALPVKLNFLGQLPALRIYTQICLCFPFAASSDCEIVGSLEKGLETLSINFPWVAGQIVSEGSSHNNSGTTKIQALGKTPPLVVKDFRHDPNVPAMEDLRHADFPFRMLDENIIAPRTTLPGPDEDPISPAFLVQANFIHGGLVLTLVGHHSAMDMTGQGQVIHLLSKACRGDTFTELELESGNLVESHLIPLLDGSYGPGPELNRQIIRPGPPQPSVPLPRSTWSYFSFDKSSLVKLKLLAEQSKDSEFISTDDALSAFVWQSVLRARLKRLSASHNTTLGRAVDVRKYFGIPPTYTGLMQNMVYHTDTIQDLLDKPLGIIASQLRTAIDPQTSSLQSRTRALATYIERLVDKSSISFGASFNPSTDIMISSWASVNCYELDFGFGLGKPEAVRRPQFTPFEGLIYFMPKRSDGEIAVALSLQEEDMARLAADEEFKKFGKYIP
ncbi:transferase family-domain-containing protein [Aspergillus caelatus]|uniref:Transferase family-domain-containing protein n=1 Tax=Aspergillus caelatus TaxID=61420 RepID=A0A5N7AM26_9EURO|nr:transferase family-domain-containing protein [Aspergillus caelatus]KAE8370942.1 transferase family-domain-containing protein [Aspergillus caelatus]